MKKKYFKCYINPIPILIKSKTWQLFLIAFLIGYNSFAQSISSFTPTNACINSGESIIITGSGFTGTTDVNFNSMTASYTINSDTQITAILPATATTGTISITTPLGTSTSIDTFIVNTISIPSVSILANPVSPICSGTSVTFTATPVNGGSNPVFQWYVAGIPVGSNSPTFTTSTLINGNQVKVEMTSNAICPVPATITSNILTITVNPLLTPSVTIEADQTIFCSGTSVTFSVDVLTNGGLTPTYQWKLNGSAIIGANNSIYTTTSLVNNDIITLDVTSSATCSLPAMVSSNSIQVTVNPNVPASVNIISNDADNTICSGTSITFTAIPTNGGTAPSYQWYVGAIPVGSNSVTYTTSSLTTGLPVTVLMTSNTTCATGSPATSNVIITTVNPNLPASVSIISNDADNTICTGTSITFTATPTNGGTTPSYQWYLGATPVGLNSTTYTTSSLTTGQSVTVIMTSNTTCATGNPATSNAIITTVSPNLPVSVSIISNDADNIICTGTNVIFTATPTNGGTSPLYQWKINGLNVGINSPTYTTSSLTNGQSVTVVMTSNEICATGSPASSNAIVTTVNPNLPASVSIISNDADNTICVGNSVTFTATPTNGGITPSYQWKLNGSNVGTNSATYTTTTLANNDVVTVVLTSNATPCVTATPATSNTITIIVNPNATIALTSAVSTTLQNVCRLSAITNITYAVTGANTISSTTGLPSGVTAILSGGIVTISGTISATAGTYNYTITTTGPCVNVSASGTIIVWSGNPTGWNGSASISISPSFSICPPATITLTAPSGASNLQYYNWILPSGWIILSGNLTNSISVSVTTAALTGNRVVTVQAVNPCGIMSTSTPSNGANAININNFTGVTVTPSNQSICSNGSISVLGTLTGNANSGTWSAPSGTFTNIITSGTSPITVSATYTPSIISGNVVLTMTTNNPTGCSTQPGNATVALTVNQVITITSQPLSTQTICSGTNANFSVTATGTGITYQWRKGTTNLVNGGNVSGANSQNLVLTGVSTTDTGSYNVVVSGTSPCAAITSSNAVLVVNQTVAISSQPLVTQTICTGNSVSFSVTATGTGLTYQWRKAGINLTNGGTISGATTAILTINPVVSGDASDYDVVITGTAPCNAVTSNSSALVVNEAIVINSQPVATQTICSGTNVNFSVTATGTGITYQWRKGNTNLVNGGNISGANSQNLVLTGVSTTDTGSYNVVVSGASPCAAITSSNAVLVVNQTVAISSQPLVTQTVCTGNSVSFSITATGTGLTYQWRKAGINLTNGGTISGATTAILTINPVVSGDAASDYDVVITGTAPCNAITSNSSALVVNEAIIINSQPVATQTICSGTNANFSVTATGTGITYQWRKGTTNLVNGGNISGANSQNLTISNVTTTDAANNYNVVITGTNPCLTATSNNAILLINRKVSIGTQPSNVGICASSPAQFSVVASGDGLTYQWFKGTFPGTAVTNNTTITGAQTNILNFSQAFLSDDGIYYVVVSGASSCTSVRSNEITLNVDQSILITSQPITQTVCEGASNISFSVTANANGDPLTYQWRKNNSNIIGQTSSLLTINNISTVNSGNYDVVISGPSGYTCPTVQSAIAILTVTRIPTATISYTGTPFCNSISTPQAVTLSGTNAYIGGLYSAPGGLTINSATGTITPNTSTIGTYTVTYTGPSTGGCAPAIATTSVTITPLPSATISYTGTPFCNSINTAQAVTLSGTNAYTGGIYSASSGLTINSATGTITPSTSIAGTYTVTYTSPTSGGCTPAIATTIVTITALPTASISYLGTPFCNSINTAQAVTLSGTNAYIGGTYSALGGLTINSATGAITPSTSTLGTYTVTYTGPTNGGCAPAIATTIVTITALPTATISYQGTPFCNSINTAQAVTLSGTNAYTGGTYSAPGGLTINTITGAITPSTSIAGTYIVTYTIPISGGCIANTVTTSVTINSLSVATFNYGATNFCKGGVNPVLSFIGGGVAGIFSSTPAGLSINALTGAINLAASSVGAYTVINSIPASGGCIPVSHSVAITIDAVTAGGSITGFASNDPLTISTIITTCHLGAGFLTLSGETGTILRWEYSTNGGVSWLAIVNTTDSYNFSNITQTTLYRAVIQSGTCDVAYSSISIVNVIPPNIKPDPVSASPSVLCLGDSSLFTSQSSYGTGQFLQGGNFQTGQLNTQDPNGWLVDSSPGGYTASADNTKSNHWAGTNPHSFPGGITYDSGDPKFAIANGSLTTTLQTPIFNSLGLTTFTFTFDQAYNLLSGDRILIELSLNGGGSYTVILQDIIGPAKSALFNPFANDNTTFNLQNYIGQMQLRVKFTFIGANANSAWALDNFNFPDGPPAQTIEWTDEDGSIISTTSTASVKPVSPGIQVYGVTTLINGCRSSGINGTTFVTINVNFAYAGKDVTILPADCGNNTVTLNAYDNRLSAEKNIAKGAWDNNYLTDNAPGTGATGKWTIKSTTAISPCNTILFSPSDTDPNATFTGDAGTYVLTWTSGGCSDDVTVTFADCSSINFDGVNDNITFKNNYNLNLTNSFSIEVWIKPNSVTGTQTIFSKRDANNLTDGYDLKLVGNIISFNWNNGGTIPSLYAITTNRWYHVAVTFDSGIYTLYIDGIKVSNPGGVSGVIPSINNSDCILGAMDQTGSPLNKPINYFNGWMDEFRVWNKALTPEQLHQMMNQEIKSNGTAVTGVIIPIDVDGLSWTTNLLGYYQMSSISCGYLNPTKGTIVGKLRNITTMQQQTAPIPYTSKGNGNWIDTSASTPWTYGNSVWDYPNSKGYNNIPIDWNIVRTGHNITSNTQDIILLGLLVDVNQLTITGTGTQNENNLGQGLWITHYLKLNGSIDLVGESQLVQKRYTSTQFSESIFDEDSSGYIERDQQGQQNSFNYNYWSSPVTIQGGVNNAPYTISSVLKDGTNSSSPGTITFGDGAYFADSALSNPIKISNRWLWSYNSLTPNSNTNWDNYYQWKYIGSTGLLKTGEGYTMKGSGGAAPVTSTQNYVFIGKPNSGTISLSIAPEDTYLIGNPYPSALDAKEFIKDNLKDCIGCRANANIFNGALYFWDHFDLSNNHFLAQYEGGYAIYNLMAAFVAIANDPLTINDNSSGTKKPKQYIPVAQGFFIDAALDSSITGLAATVQGGTINFKNNQRAFVRETSGSSIFMKSKESKKTEINPIDNRPKITLSFISSTGKNRRLLVGVDSNTTNLFDIGYDAPMLETTGDNFYWEFSNGKFVIQGVPNFDEDQIIPIGLTIANEGLITIKIDTLENISQNTTIYLYDNISGNYYDMKNSAFTIPLTIGEYKNRFSLRFTCKPLDVEENTINDGVLVLYSNNYKVLIIQNKVLDMTVKEVHLFNLLGQDLAKWDVENRDQSKIQIPIKNQNSGVYIVKLKTSKENYSKKIIIK